MEWFVDVTGEAQDLEELARSCNSEELCIAKKEQGFILKSSGFSSLTDAKDVANKADDILTYLNGAARLILGMRKPLAAGGVNRINDNGTINTFVSLSVTVTARVDIDFSLTGADGKVQRVNPADMVPKWILSAEKDINVAKVLRLYSTGDFGWANLYGIYEVMKSDMRGPDNIVKSFGVTKKAISRFTHTANSPDAPGGKTRHSIGQPPPANPMSLPEAKSFIDGIVHNWFNLK